MLKNHLIISFILLLAFQESVSSRVVPQEKQLLSSLRSGTLDLKGTDYRCDAADGYTVFLIDNFDEKIDLIPEVSTSHGDLVRRLLISGRTDITVNTLNTALSNGLAAVIRRLLDGECADAVISSIPGSNYSYYQINSLYQGTVPLMPSNILEHRKQLLSFIHSIALHGFPSTAWFNKADVNPIKLREDARKIAFIDTLGRMKVPVILPYGNLDSRYKSDPKPINILSLSQYAITYSGSDSNGKRLEGFPYSPLSSGDGQAVYSIVECPDAVDARIGHIDINEDTYIDYSYLRQDFIPYYSEQGELLFASPLLEQGIYEEILQDPSKTELLKWLKLTVITSEQYKELSKICPSCVPPLPPGQSKSLLWLHSEPYGSNYSFNPQCQVRGEITGTSLIPPIKVKELLPPALSR